MKAVELLPLPIKKFTLRLFYDMHLQDFICSNILVYRIVKSEKYTNITISVPN